jgi:Lamin Tail Domain/Bacterial Ig-like domain
MAKKLLLLLPVILLKSLLIPAQVSENFADGDFTNNPVWTGISGDWIINASFQLQSNNTIANSSFYLSTPSSLAVAAQWQFYVNLAFATSGANYTDVYLTASTGDLNSIGTTGYFVRIGNTADEISLYRKDAGVATGTKLIDGADGAVNSSSNNSVKIKVIRDANNQWILLRDNAGTGNNYFTEGTVTDNTFTTSSFFGFVIKQSTVAGFAKKHFFDDIEITRYTPDTIPPLIQNITVTSANTLDVVFSEPVDSVSGQAITNYFASTVAASPATAVADVSDKAVVHLTFVNSFLNGINYLLTVNGVKDLWNNTLLNGTAAFTYFAPYTAQQYDVVIDEIMADPSPLINLPDNEWIELKNTSGFAINMQGFKISDATGTSGATPEFILLPDSFLIVCSSSAASAMAPYGKVISVTNFPSLDNENDQLSLIAPQGKIIHSVNYSSAWYQNALKKNGGWSLEMIDARNPCSGISNWKASTDLKGGSPGSKNTADAINPDLAPPKLLRAYAADNKTITLVFDEPLDSFKAAAVAGYYISDGIGVPLAVVASSPVADKVNLHLTTELAASKIYTITVAGITDCVGNATGLKNTARVALSAVADSLDIVINEILFNPPPAGSDYVEIYNRSNKVIDLKQTYIANRNSNGSIGNITQVSAENYLLFPQDFMVLTSDITYVKSTYITQNQDAFININLPSFNDDKGNIILLNVQGNTTDELAYNNNWHFKLLNNTEGIALERIDYNAPTQSADNWHSAATSAGYGTPTYKNSQYRINDGLQGEVKLSPEIVSPDNDGQDDFATLEYNFPEPGYAASITVFDAAGRPVRYLQRNALCGTKGTFRWDGLGEKNQTLAVGIYIVYTEVFNLEGKIKQFKIPVVLAGKN